MKDIKNYMRKKISIYTEMLLQDQKYDKEYVMKINAKIEAYRLLLDYINNDEN